MTFVLYPFIVYYLIQYLSVSKIALGLLIVFLIRFRTEKSKIPHQAYFLTGGLILFLFAIWNNDLITLRFYPVFMNLFLLLIFLVSLFHPPTVIERIARIQHPNLPPEGVAYTRTVTKVWSVFFLVNGLISFYTALWASFDLWSIYNGFIAYILMGLLMSVEYLIRIKTQQHIK